MRSFSILPLLLLAAPVAAQDPATDPTCANVRVAIPAELVGWSEQIPVTAGVKPGDGATVIAGKAYAIALQPAEHLALSPAPTRPSEPGSKGGVVSIAITQAGTYRVALGAGAWIDLVGEGKPVATVAHDHGPKCMGIRKIVDFALTPGSYTIQLSNAKTATLPLMLVKLK